MMELKKHLDRFGQLWGESTAEVTLEFGRRMTATLGRCYPARELIRLNPSLQCGFADLTEEVLCHEFAHLVVFRRHGRKAKPHGPEWKALVEAAGLPPRTGVPVRQHSRPKPKLYLHRCPVCRTVRTARAPVRRWRCRPCVEAGNDGVLEIRQCPPPPS